MTFSGEYQHAIDEKGRLIIPSKYRDRLGNTFMLHDGQKECLFVYPMEVWAKLEEKLSGLNDFKRRDQDFKRRFFSGSEESEVDRQGRTLISQKFRSRGKLAKEVYIVGAGDHLEIWDKEIWEQYRSGLDEEYETLAEEIFQ